MIELMQYLMAGLSVIAYFMALGILGRLAYGVSDD